jgi:hypothetical protein
MMERDNIIRGLTCWTLGIPCHEKCPILEHQEGLSCLRLTTRCALALIKDLTEENDKLKAELANRPPKLIITRRNTRRK